jgi:hypothetical protein
MFTLKINTDNAAFEGDRDAEVARILKVAADCVLLGRADGILRDALGNSVGTFRMTGTPARPPVINR